MATIRFYVNVDHVATIREARKTTEPDPLEAAHACMRGGAHGITVHLREDRRHINDADVRRIAAAIEPVNLELACTDDIVQIALEIKPHQVTFVPERREEITTEGGLRLRPDSGNPDPRLQDAITRLHEGGIRVSLFIDPDLPSVEDALTLGADAIELHTGKYANQYPAPEPLARLQTAATATSRLGLAVHAGHGLTTENVTRVAAIPELEELSIGHHIVSRSVLVGMEKAVQEMQTQIDDARVDRS